MGDLENTFIQCPYCGEQIEILVDKSIPYQDYIEDCQVCCKPMVLKININEVDRPMVEVLREDS